MTELKPDDVKITRYQYDDLPLTLFPADVDVSEGSINEDGTIVPGINRHPYMIDINSNDTKSLVTQFDDYYSRSNWAECQNMLDDDLNLSTFNAEKYNLLSDSIIALQRFAKEGMKQDKQTTIDYLHEAVNNKLGQNFNIDYRVSLEFIEQLTKILKEE